VPAPANPSRLWNDYVAGEGEKQKLAMEHMINNGFAKYDVFAFNKVKSLDAGVLSIRDFLLAVDAEWYVTCQGDFRETCRECFRSGSNIVMRIKMERDSHRIPREDKNGWIQLLATEFFWYVLNDIILQYKFIFVC
jgi:hypothetical protein